MNEGKTLAKESEVLVSEAKKSANSTITYDVKLIAVQVSKAKKSANSMITHDVKLITEGKAPQKGELNTASYFSETTSSKNVSWPDDKI